ncbi:MAG: efflux RND transporter periplasmic adaptor subunit [Planctomycetes bacterium]|nr:efflux RND transporter periplasmic adaptor subunit [Planctomycetota bacterium]
MNDRKNLPILLGGALCLIALGFWIGRTSSSPATGSDASHDRHGEMTGEKNITTWTCSMHPQIKLPKKGKCPICFMDLIPLNVSGDEDDGERTLNMSKAAMALAEVETRILERKEAFVMVDMVGKVVVDTTRISDVALLADSELRRLFVNYAGIPVKKGDHLAELYSPEVYAAGQDLLVAMDSRSTGSDVIKSSILKLELLGVPEDYVNDISNLRKVSQTFTLKSPIDGYVEDLSGYQGMWIKKGTKLCQIVDMKSLWVNLDAYESDLAWIRYGQKVTIRAEALPGTIILGVVSYIPPRLDDRSRTVKIRINVDNSKGLLKPGMFVSAELKARVTDKGGVTSPELQGKWISPMHPEIVKDAPGKCDICGMALVRAEELGYSFDERAALPLLLPASSVLITGKRAVVYVRIPGDKPVFEGREVELGPRTGDGYVVLTGLKEEERVVVKGNFKIDSALQIQAKPSMMSMTGGESLLKPAIKSEGVTLIDNAVLRESLGDLLGFYLQIRDKLSKDELAGLSELASDMKGALVKLDESTLKGEEGRIWKNLRENIEDSLEHLPHQNSLDSFREGFKSLSAKLITIINQVGHPMKSLNLMYCSMAEAEWLQEEQGVANPYYGSSMLQCGELMKALPSVPAQH